MLGAGRFIHVRTDTSSGQKSEDILEFGPTARSKNKVNMNLCCEIVVILERRIPLLSFG